MEKITMTKKEFKTWYDKLYKTTKIKNGSCGKSIHIVLPNNYSISFTITNLGVKGAKDKLFEKFNERIEDYFTICDF
jgi:hypothetical protein